MKKVKKLPLKIGKELNLTLKNNDYLFCDGLGGDFKTTLGFINKHKNIKLNGVLKGQAISCHSLIFFNCHNCYLSDFASVYIHPLKFNINLSLEIKKNYQEIFKNLINYDLYIPERGRVLTAKELVRISPEKFQMISPNLSCELYLQNS